MLNIRRIVLAALASLIASQVDAATPCPAGPLSTTAAQLRDFPPAQAYCTAIFPVAPKTATRTAAPITITQTVGTTTTTINGGPITITVPALPVTITTSIPATNVTVTDPVNTVTLSGTSTITVTNFTSTITTTTITTLSRGVPVAREAAPTADAEVEARQAGGLADAILFASVVGRPSSAQAKICTCLEKRTTNTVTRTPTSRIQVTATSTVGGDTTSTITTTPTITSTVNLPASTITTILTITNFDPVNTVTNTVNAVATAVATITIPANGPNCNATGDFLSLGVGGCSSNCYCDLRKSDTSGFCNNGLLPTSQATNFQCTTDADCVNGATCASDSSVLAPAGTCLDFTGCLSTFDALTGTFPGKGPVGTIPIVVGPLSKVGRKSGKKGV